MKRIFLGTIFVPSVPWIFFRFNNILISLKKDVVQQKSYFPYDANFRVFPVLKLLNSFFSFLFFFFTVKEKVSNIVSTTSAQGSSKKKVLKNYAKLTLKQLCWSLFHNEIADQRHKTKLSCSHYTFFV